MILTIIEFKDYRKNEVIKKDNYKLSQDEIDQINKKGFTDTFILNKFKGNINPWKGNLKFTLQEKGDK